MVLGIGVGAYTAGMLQLTTNAFFKALLFLGAGSVIHAMSGEQDMRKMGGLRKKLPITFATMVLGWLAISGIFPFSGFWSKDEILAAAFAHGGYFVFLWAIGVVAALLTAFYMTRLMILTFGGAERWPDGVEASEAPRILPVPLGLLAVVSATAATVNPRSPLAPKHEYQTSWSKSCYGTPPDQTIRQSTA